MRATTRNLKRKKQNKTMYTYLCSLKILLLLCTSVIPGTMARRYYIDCIYLVPDYRCICVSLGIVTKTYPAHFQLTLPTSTQRYDDVFVAGNKPHSLSTMRRPTADRCSRDKTTAVTYSPEKHANTIFSGTVRFCPLFSIEIMQAPSFAFLSRIRVRTHTAGGHVDGGAKNSPGFHETAPWRGRRSSERAIVIFQHLPTSTHRREHIGYDRNQLSAKL